MHYFIDGYNLLFQINDEEESSLQNKRNQLIEDLDFMLKDLAWHVTLVFDAALQIEDFSRTHFRNLELIFTAEGETADEYIIEALHTLPCPQNETIVTSDKSLARILRTLGANTQSVKEFLAFLKKKKQKRVLNSKRSPPKKENPISLKKNIDPTSGLFHYYLEVFEKKYKEYERTNDID